MGQDRKQTRKRLTDLWNSADVEVLSTEGLRYAIISDTHLGNGGAADDLRNNADLLVAALRYYNEHEYRLILLGDIEELWQFDQDEVTEAYGKTVYKAMRAFCSDGRHNLYRVYGNHDIDWKRSADPATGAALVSSGPAHPHAVEALKMRVGDGDDPSILLVHGHQGSTESDRNSWISRLAVRAYRHFEPVVKVDPHADSPKSQVIKDYEKIMYDWAKARRVLLICGHSHRAVFASKSHYANLDERIVDLQVELHLAEGAAASSYETSVDRKVRELVALQKELFFEEDRGRKAEAPEKDGSAVPCYFNTGCALYNSGITSIEIAGGNIALMKWNHDKPERKEFRSENLAETIAHTVARNRL